MSSAFNGSRYLALVFGAGACLAPGADLTLVSHKSLYQADILVVDYDFLISAELAFAWTGIKSPFYRPTPAGS